MTPASSPLLLDDRFDPQAIIYGLPEPLLTSEVFLRSLDRHMPEQKLDLLKLSPGIVTESSTRSPKIVGSELRNSQSARVVLHDVPDYFFGNLRTPSGPPCDKRI